MQRFGVTSSLRMVCAVAGTAIVLSGCAAVRSPNPDPAAPAPGRSTSPTKPPAPSPANPSDSPDADASEAPAMGLDVRYVDKDGEFKTLRVKDFPR